MTDQGPRLADAPTSAPTSAPTLVRNVAVLSALQLASHAILLSTLPYLARTLGVEAFGRLALAQVLVQYSVMLVDYGFNWSATQRIAAGRADKAALSALFSSTLLTQVLLAVLITGVLGAVWALGGPHLRLANAGPNGPLNGLFSLPIDLLLAAMLGVLGAALTPLWLLHGTERMQDAAVIQLLGRLAVLPLLWWCVHDSGDAALALWILGGASLASGVAMLVWVLQRQIVRWQWPSAAALWQRPQQGFAVFSSTLAISLYTVLPGLALGSMVSAAVFAQFAIADRVRVAVMLLLQPLASALLPRMSHLFATDRPAALTLLRHSVWVTVLLAGGASSLLFLGAETIVQVIAGPGYGHAAVVLRWMSPLPLVVSLSSVASLLVLLPNQRVQEFNAVVVAGGVFAVATVGWFIATAQAVGVAQFLLVTELAIGLAMWALAARRVLWQRH